MARPSMVSPTMAELAKSRRQTLSQESYRNTYSTQNEIQLAPESTDQIRKRYIEQNQTLARTNSQLLAKIRALDSKINELTKENIHLRQQNRQNESFKELLNEKLSLLEKGVFDKFKEVSKLFDQLRSEEKLTDKKTSLESHISTSEIHTVHSSTPLPEPSSYDLITKSEFELPTSSNSNSGVVEKSLFDDSEDDVEILSHWDKENEKPVTSDKDFKSYKPESYRPTTNKSLLDTNFEKQLNIEFELEKREQELEIEKEMKKQQEERRMEMEMIRQRELERIEKEKEKLKQEKEQIQKRIIEENRRKELELKSQEREAKRKQERLKIEKEQELKIYQDDVENTKEKIAKKITESEAEQEKENEKEELKMVKSDKESAKIDQKKTIDVKIEPEKENAYELSRKRPRRCRKEVDYKPNSLNRKLRRKSNVLFTATGDEIASSRKALTNITNTNTNTTSVKRENV